jgi:hypothetical protein
MTTKIFPSIQPTLYEEDYYLWIETTLQQLQNQDIENLDWQHLAEEIEALGIEQRRKVEIYLKQLLIFYFIVIGNLKKNFVNEVGKMRFLIFEMN